MNRAWVRSTSPAVLVFLLTVLGMAQKPSVQVPILPEQFGGWQRQGPVVHSADPAKADAANSAILKEYGFTDFESATYKKDGRSLTLRAARFDDATGAFGAYSFYLRPEMAREEIGDQAASASPRVLFYRGHVLMDAVFSTVTLMSPAELRELAAALPRPPGSARNLPPVLAYMPKREYTANTQKYAEGPLALAQFATPLEQTLVDFTMNPEISLSEYRTPSGPVKLTLIEYPTPQIAIEQLRRIDGALAAQGRTNELLDRRSGPLVILAGGNATPADTKVLLGAVNYEATGTWNENTYFDKKDNAANLIFNGILLAIVITGASLIFGIFFGGFRILMKRLYPGKMFDRPQQMEIIRLNLDGEEAAPPTGRG